VKNLVVLLFIFLALLVSNVEAQMCPSTTKFIRIVAYEDAKPIRLNALQIPPQMLPGDDTNCPNQTVVAKMMEIDNQNQTIVPMPILIEQGAISNPDNVLTDEEVKLYQEKGIVNPPNIRYNTKPKETPVPKALPKGSTTANVKANALHSSIN